MSKLVLSFALLTLFTLAGCETRSNEIMVDTGAASTGTPSHNAGPGATPAPKTPGAGQ